MLALQQQWLQLEWQQQEPLFLALAESLIRTLIVPRGHDDAGEGASPRDDQRLTRLRQLVELHYRQHRDLDFYADALGLTRRTLSRLTSAQLGCTPMDLVHRRLALEAQRLLRFTNASATQVATELGFDDPSYFSRFYLRMTGKRPGQERG